MATISACGSSPANTSSGDGGNAGDDGGSQMMATDSGTAQDTGPASSHDAGAADAHPEAAAEGGLDHGSPSSTYPAFTPSMAQLQNNGGLVMTNPIIVAITWAADPSESSFQSFADNIGATAYWKAASSEYGVGPAVSGPTNHVSMTGTPPTSFQDTDLQNLVITNAGVTAGWPAPTDNTIYAFFLPPGALLYQGQTGAGNDACSQGIGGYHSQVTAGSVTTSYAVVPSCTFGGTNTAAQQTTMSMSHELLEASTDPQPQGSSPGWVGFDQDHFAFDWFLEFSDENGDACEAYRDSFFEDKETMPAFDFWVQRTWSNKMGPLGHDPCQIGDEPYFNVAILNLTEVTVTLPAGFGGSTAQNIQVLGVKAPVGKSTTVELGLYSDAPTAPFTVTWGQGSPFLMTPPTYLDATIDVATGVNGNKAYATVTPNAAGTLKAELLWFKSTLNGVSHIMPVVVSSYESD